MQHPIKKDNLFFLSATQFLLLLFIILFFSCASKKSTEFTFVGRWKTDREATIAQMNVAQRHRYDSQPEPVKKLFNDAVDGRFYEFKQDGTVVFIISRSGKTNSFTGTWKYNADSAKLVTISDVVTRFNVSVTSPDKVILKNETALEKAMLNDWVLQRIKN